jgi:F-type H+-transporting ATPase subunit delta
MSKTDSKVAKRYARALFESCQPQNFDSVQAALFSLSEAVTEHSVREAFINPSLNQQQKIDWLQAAIKELCPSEEKSLSNLMAAVIDNGRIVMLPELAQHFAFYVSSYKKLLKLEVTSAKELSEQELKQISDEIKARLPKDIAPEVSFDWKTDQSLIAGLKVKVGDKIVDGSVQSAISNIAKQIKL